MLKPVKYFLIAVVFVAVVVFLYVKGHKPSGAMGGMGGMRGMMSHMAPMTDWMNGRTLAVDFKTPKPPRNETSLNDGKLVYESRCSICHGLKGDGNGERAKNLVIKPRDFRFGVFKFRSTPSGSPATEEDIFTTVSRGLHGTAMLPWLGLSTPIKWKVVYYVQFLSEFYDPNEKPEIVKIPTPVKSPEDYAKLGAEVYKKAKCFECHGNEGYGDGEKTDKLKDDWGFPIRPTNLREQVLKRGLDVKDIYLTIATGLNGTPMPTYANALSEQEMLAVAFHVWSIAPERPERGMMGAMMNMAVDERIGMRTDMPGMPMDGGMTMGN